MTKRRVKTTALMILTAALFSLLIGCEVAAVQTLDVYLATPTPPPQVVALGESGDEEEASYDITIVSQNQGEVQADGSILTQDGLSIRVLEGTEPTPTIPLTPTPVPTAPPETPTPTPSPIPSPTPTPTEEPTAKPTAKPTSKIASTPKVTSTPKPTATPKPAPTAAPDTTFSITPEPTATPAPTQAPTATPVTTSTQTPPDVSGPYSGEDILLAARVAYFESGRSEDGYRAVLCVILNRVESSKWPNSVNDVVYQKSQFSVVGRSDFLTKTIPDSVINYANDVFNSGNRLLPTNVMSFRSGASDKTWGTRTYYATYGGNDFYS